MRKRVELQEQLQFAGLSLHQDSDDFRRLSESLQQRIKAIAQAWEGAVRLQPDPRGLMLSFEYGVCNIPSYSDEWDAVAHLSLKRLFGLASAVTSQFPAAEQGVTLTVILGDRKVVENVPTSLQVSEERLIRLFRDHVYPHLDPQGELLPP